MTQYQVRIMSLTDYLYHPLCTKNFTFESLFSTCSISPNSFYPRRDFGTNYNVLIPQVHHPDALVLYNQMPQFDTNYASNVSKFILAIDRKILDQSCLNELTNDIYYYSKTIYLTKSNFKIFFLSEKDRTIAILKTETSLITKNVKQYEKNILVTSEDLLTHYDTSSISSLKNSDRQIESQIQFDKTFNATKGLLAGMMLGIQKAKVPSHIAAQRLVDEVKQYVTTINNRIQFASSKYKRPQVNNSLLSKLRAEFETSMSSLEQHIISITNIEAATEEEIAEFLFQHTKRFSSFSDVQEYINYVIITDSFTGRNDFALLTKFYYKNQPNKIDSQFYLELIRAYVDQIFDSLVENQSNLLSRGISESDYEVSVEKIKEFIDNHWTTSADLKLKYHHDFDINFEEKTIAFLPSFSILTTDEAREFSIMIKIVLNNSKNSKNETSSDQILLIVKLVSEALSSSVNGEKSQLYKYLNNEIKNYSIEKINDDILKNFVSFTFNSDSFDNLVNFNNARGISKSWIAVSLWCAYNGYANIPGVSENSIFSKSTENSPVDLELENICDDLIDKYQPKCRNTDNETNHSKENADFILKVSQFYRQFIESRYSINYTDFLLLAKLKSKAHIKKNLTEKCGIGKTDSKKIADSFFEFMSSLF